jgi:hypothetical protein
MKKSKFYKIASAFGKVFVDLGKLAFGSLVLGTIIKGEITQSALLWTGSVTACAAIIIGVLLTTLDEE